MALTVFTKANNNAALNLTTSWVGLVAPNANTAQMLVDGTQSSSSSPTTGASFTLGQIKLTNPVLAFSILSTAATAITLDTTDPATLGVGIDMSAATQNMTITENLVLGTSQSWSVASGRTLTVSGALTGAVKNLTLTGTGIKTLSGVSTGWTGSTVTVSAGRVNATSANALGAAENIVVVDSGACLSVSAAIVQTSITASGAGFTGGTGYSALTTTNALVAGQTFTFGATGTVLTVTSATFAPALSVSAGVAGITLNISTSTATGLVFTGTNTYSLGVENAVRIQSLFSNGTTRGTGRFGFGIATTATDADRGLGAIGNNVVVETTGAIVYPPVGGTLTLSRNYEFLASTSPTNEQCIVISSTSTMDFAGTVTLTGSAGQAASFVGPNTYGNLPGIKFSGTITGAADLWIGRKVNAGAAVSTSLGANLVSSAWTGTLYTDAINYYGDGTSIPTFPVVFFSTTNFINAVGNASANHSSYSKTVSSTVTFNPSSIGQTGNLTFGGGPFVSAANIGTWQTDAGTLTLNFSFTGTLAAFTKTGVSTLILAGNNTAFSGVVLSAGTLTLNSVGSAGPSAATFTINGSSSLDSTTGAVLAQNGAVVLSSNFTWGGSADLTFGTGALSWNAARTLAFLNGKTGKLKFQGNIGALTSLLTLSVGGAPVGGSRSCLWFTGTNGMLALTSTVTAGYFRVSNASGLGNASTTLWTVSSGAALEVDGGISPTSARNVTITGPGPNIDGALRSVSGTNVWNGSIVPPVQSLASPTRIQVDAGTFTLAAGTYTTIAPTVLGTPLQFTALGATAILNQPRQFTATVSDVTVNNGGTGKVVFSVANLHTGTMTCSAGTTKVTHINATSTGNVTVPAGATLESTVQSQFQSTLSLGTNLSLSRAILKFAA